MINELEIHNFKSIKDLTLPCKRFNLFIGEPNTGKSNILEALGLLSYVSVRQLVHDPRLDEFVRHDYTSNLFYDDDIDLRLSIRCDHFLLDLAYEGAFFRGTYSDGNQEICRIGGGFGTVEGINPPSQAQLLPVRYYRFSSGVQFDEFIALFLMPPSGCNLPALLIHDRTLRQAVADAITSRGLVLSLRPRRNEIELVKSFDDNVLVSYPLSLSSDTLQRVVFYTAAILTNKQSILVFEEPEAHSFPGETKILAEQIAMDENDNQYFIVTHNPYFLMPLLSKAPKNDIAINIVYSEDYQTKIRPLEPEELPELFEINIFANLKRYLEE